MTGPELARSTVRRLTPAMVLSNLTGAVDVFVFTFFLLPVRVGSDPHRQRVVNVVVFVVFMVISTAFGQWSGRRHAAPVLDWLVSDRPASDADRGAALRLPLRQAYLNGSIWLGAALLFGALNTAFDAVGALHIAGTIALGGFTTTAIAYLLAERIMRPVVSRAMAGASTAPPVLLGVKPRLLLAWGLGSGLPLAGIALGLMSAGHDGQIGRGAILFLVAVALGAGFVSITAAAGAVSDPVRSVGAALRRVGDGDLDVEVPVYDASEVGELQSGFNAMVQGLRERAQLRDLFGRQVGDDVARLALERGAELGGELREVAVLFVDIVGSTTLATEMDPQEVVRLLNGFFAVVIDVVQEHGGWVNKFEGDAALCVFGAPVEVPDPATCALAAARAMAARLRDLSVDAAIGVCAGPVVAGHVGAESRFEYTVIGDPVNAAARLTELAKAAHGCVLADAALLRPGSPEADHWEPGESVVLRGRRTATTLARPR